MLAMPLVAKLSRRLFAALPPMFLASAVRQTTTFKHGEAFDKWNGATSSLCITPRNGGIPESIDRHDALAWEAVSSA